MRTGLSSVNDVDASTITSGTLNAARLPSIDKTKVSNTGAWETSEIPELSKTKISTAETWQVAEIPFLPKSQIQTPGTWDTTDIPELPKTKIADAGTWDATEIPDLSATKITSDRLDVNRIPELSAAQITSGTFDAARIPATDLMAVSQVGSGDDYTPAHLFRSPNMYTFIDSGSIKTRLVFGCEDVVDSSNLQHPLLDSTCYHKCVCINIPQGWSATSVYISQWRLVNGVVYPYQESITDQPVMELPRFHYIANVATQAGNNSFSFSSTTRSFTTNTTMHLNSTLTLSTDTTQISLGPAGDLRQMIIKIGTPRNSFNYSLYLPGGYVELEEIS